MLKRIAASIAAAVVFPFFYLIFIGRNDIFTRSDSIADERGYNYTLLCNHEDIMFIKSDSVGRTLGKWKTDRTNGYNYISAEAMKTFRDEFYCILTEINSKD